MNEDRQSKSSKSRSTISKLLWPPQGLMQFYGPYVAIGTVLWGIIYVILHQSVFHPFGCQPKAARVHNEATNEVFIDQQLIVMGTKEALQAVQKMSFGDDQDIHLNLIEDCNLSYWNTRNDSNSKFAGSQPKLSMQLYEIEIPADKHITVEAVIGEIIATDPSVSVDPNYLTFRSDAATRSTCALPNGGGGGTGGTPLGEPGIPNTSAEIRTARDAFMKQWAFDQQGINLRSSATSVGTRAGGEVYVAVFDASPFQNLRPIGRYIGIAQPSPLRLTTIGVPGVDRLPANQPAGQGNGRNHGLFVAGLIHAIAPNANIQLIRVLNDDGYGELWVLNKALEEYTSRMSALTSDLDEVEINMSLAICIPTSDEERAKLDKVDWAKLDKELKTFKAAIDKADGLGAIIVAAAGNSSPSKDKNGNTIDPMSTLYPAAYANVIGVAATSDAENRTCYSNKVKGQDVAAPGGQGGKVEVKAGGTTIVNPCGSRASNWDQADPNGVTDCSSADPAHCPYILISLGMTDHGLQYIYWSGTSFATPLVTGLGALAYQEEEKPTALCIIRQGADTTMTGRTSGPRDPDLGKGIIDINATFSPAVIQLCQ